MEVVVVAPDGGSCCIEVGEAWGGDKVKKAACEGLGMEPEIVELHGWGVDVAQGDVLRLIIDEKAAAIKWLRDAGVTPLSTQGAWHAAAAGKTEVVVNYLAAGYLTNAAMTVSLAYHRYETAKAILSVATHCLPPSSLSLALKRGYYDLAVELTTERGCKNLPRKVNPYVVTARHGGWRDFFNLLVEQNIETDQYTVRNALSCLPYEQYEFLIKKLEWVPLNALVDALRGRREAIVELLLRNSEKIHFSHNITQLLVGGVQHDEKLADLIRSARMLKVSKKTSTRLLCVATASSRDVMVDLFCELGGCPHTALHHCISTTTVSIICNHGGDPNRTTPTAVMTAAKHGRLPVLKSLLENGGDPTQHCPNGNTPVFVAAAAGHLDVVKLLVQHGAPWDVRKTCGGFDAVAIAAKKAHLEIVKYIISELSTQVGVYYKGLNLVHLNASGGVRMIHKELAGLLGVDVYERDGDGRDVMMHAALGGGDVPLDVVSPSLTRRKDDKGTTALGYAARFGDVGYFKCLVENRSNVNAVYSEGCEETILDVVLHRDIEELRVMYDVLRQHHVRVRGVATLLLAVDRVEDSGFVWLLYTHAHPRLRDDEKQQFFFAWLSKRCLPHDVYHSPHFASTYTYTHPLTGSTFVRALADSTWARDAQPDLLRSLLKKSDCTTPAYDATTPYQATLHHIHSNLRKVLAETLGPDQCVLELVVFMKSGGKVKLSRSEVETLLRRFGSLQGFSAEDQVLLFTAADVSLAGIRGITKPVVEATLAQALTLCHTNTVSSISKLHPSIRPTHHPSTFPAPSARSYTIHTLLSPILEFPDPKGYLNAAIAFYTSIGASQAVGVCEDVLSKA